MMELFKHLRFACFFYSKRFSSSYSIVVCSELKQSCNKMIITNHETAIYFLSWSFRFKSFSAKHFFVLETIRLDILMCMGRDGSVEGSVPCVRRVAGSNPTPSST